MVDRYKCHPCKLIIFCCHIYCIGFDFLRNDSYSSVCNISLSRFLLMSFSPKKLKKKKSNNLKKKFKMLIGLEIFTWLLNITYKWSGLSLKLKAIQSKSQKIWDRTYLFELFKHVHFKELAHPSQCLNTKPTHSKESVHYKWLGACGLSISTKPNWGR